jgi:hypothetical protein
MFNFPQRVLGPKPYTDFGKHPAREHRYGNEAVASDLDNDTSTSQLPKWEAQANESKDPQTTENNS